MSLSNPGPGYPSPYGGGQYPTPYAPPAPRSWGKTFLVSMLMLLIPFIGSAISAVYIYDRDNPQRFDFGRAAVAAILQVVYLFLLIAIIAGILFATGILGQALQQAPTFTPALPTPTI